MAIAHTTIAPHGYAAGARKRGLLGRILDAMIESRMQAAEREIARYLETHGGRLTDDAEREIERRFMGNSGW
jgi:hypothetical protein